MYTVQRQSEDKVKVHVPQECKHGYRPPPHLTPLFLSPQADKRGGVGGSYVWARQCDVTVGQVFNPGSLINSASPSFLLCKMGMISVVGLKEIVFEAVYQIDK